MVFRFPRRVVVFHHLIGAICAAPAVLQEAGLLEGRRYTAHFSVENELKEIQADMAVVVDNGIITSRGAGTATELAKVIAQSIHHSPVPTTT